MKKINLFLSVVIVLAACTNASNSEKATTTTTQTVQPAEGITYPIDSTTTVSWTGFKPTGQHDGTFKVNEGALVINGADLTGGSFTIDLNSLNNADMAADAENKAKLEGHLKSADFFDVAKYPTAKFEITSVEPYVATTDSNKAGATHLIKGNLTLKDSTKNIAIPARVTVDTKTLSADATFSIDRTLWGINYKGPDNPQDWIIAKSVELKLNLTAASK